MRRQSLHAPTPSFVPIDNWGSSAHRPQVNAAVLQQPINVNSSVTRPAERPSSSETAPVVSDRQPGGSSLRSPSGLFKPGRRSGVPAMLPMPTSAASLQPVDLQASAAALAQQAKQEQAKQQQAASQAEAKLDKLKAMLQREQALQANVRNGSIRLADNGARLAERLAALHRDIQKQEQLIADKHTSASAARLPASTGQLSSSQFSFDSSSVSQQPNRAQADGREATANEGAGSNHLQQRHIGSNRADRGQDSQDHPPRHHTDTMQPGRQDRRSGSDRGQNGPQQLAQHAVRDSRSSQQSERGSRGNLGGRSGADSGRDRGPSRGRQSGPDVNSNGKRSRQSGTSVSQALQKQRRLWMEQLTSDAAQEANRKEAEEKASEYEPSWTYQDEAGQPQGPVPLAALKDMLAKGAVKGSLMVHDEEAEVSIRLATLIANSLHGRPAIPLLDNHAQEPSAGRAHPTQGGDQQETNHCHVPPDNQAGETKFKQRSSTPPSFDSMATSEPEVGFGGDSLVNQAHMHHIKRSESDMQQSQDPVWSPQLPLDKLAESFEVKAQQPQQSGWLQSAAATTPQMQHPTGGMPEHFTGAARHTGLPAQSHSPHVSERYQQPHFAREHSQTSEEPVQQDRHWQQAPGRPEVGFAPASVMNPHMGHPSQQHYSTDGSSAMFHQSPNQHTPAQYVYPQQVLRGHVPQANAVPATLSGMQHPAAMHQHPSQGHSHEPQSQLEAIQPPLPPEANTIPAGSQHAGMLACNSPQVATSSSHSTHQQAPAQAAAYASGQPTSLTTPQSNAGQYAHTLPSNAHASTSAAAAAPAAAGQSYQQPPLPSSQPEFQEQAVQAGQQYAAPNVMLRAGAHTAPQQHLGQHQDGANLQGISYASISAALALLQSRPQLVLPSTVLSPELSAALAAGALGQTSQHTTPTSQPTDQGFNNQTSGVSMHAHSMGPDNRHMGVDQSHAAVPSNAAPPLPPELSAALAFGQLPLSLQSSAGALLSQAPASMHSMQLSQAPSLNAHRFTPVASAAADHAVAWPHGHAGGQQSLSQQPQHAQHALPEWHAHRQAGQAYVQHQAQAHRLSQAAPAVQPAVQPSEHQQMHQHPHPAQNAGYQPESNGTLPAHLQAHDIKTPEQPAGRQQAHPHYPQQVPTIHHTQQAGVQEHLPQHSHPNLHQHPAAPSLHASASTAHRPQPEQLSLPQPPQQINSLSAAVHGFQPQPQQRQSLGQLPGSPLPPPRPEATARPRFAQPHLQQHQPAYQSPSQPQHGHPTQYQRERNVQPQQSDQAQPLPRPVTLRPPQPQHSHPDRQRAPQQHLPPQLHPEQLQAHAARGAQLQHHDRQHQQAHHSNQHQQAFPERQHQHQQALPDRQHQHQQMLPDKQHPHQQAQPHRQHQLASPDRGRQLQGQHRFPARGQHQHPQPGQHDASAEPFQLAVVPPEVYSPRGPVHPQTTPRYHDDIHHGESGWAVESQLYDMEARHDHWNAPLQEGRDRHDVPPQHMDAEQPHQAPLTAEEAEWEWQRQLAQQDEPLEADEWYEDEVMEGGLSLGDESWLEADLPYIGKDPAEYADPTGMPGQQAGAVLGQEQQQLAQGRRRRRARGGRRHRRSSAAMPASQRHVLAQDQRHLHTGPVYHDRAPHTQRQPRESKLMYQQSSSSREHRLPSQADHSRNVPSDQCHVRESDGGSGRLQRQEHFQRPGRLQTTLHSESLRSNALGGMRQDRHSDDRRSQAPAEACRQEDPFRQEAASQQRPNQSRSAQRRSQHDAESTHPHANLYASKNQQSGYPS